MEGWKIFFFLAAERKKKNLSHPRDFRLAKIPANPARCAKGLLIADIRLHVPSESRRALPGTPPAAHDPRGPRVGPCEGRDGPQRPPQAGQGRLGPHGRHVRNERRGCRACLTSPSWAREAVATARRARRSREGRLRRGRHGETKCKQSRRSILLTGLSLDPRGVWPRVSDAATPHTIHTPTRTPRGPLVPLLVWRSARCGGRLGGWRREMAPRVGLGVGV